MKTVRQTFKFVTVAATLIVSCTLPYASQASVDYPRGLNMAARRVNFDMPMVAPVKFIALSRRLIGTKERGRQFVGGGTKATCGRGHNAQQMFCAITRSMPSDSSLILR